MIKLNEFELKGEWQRVWFVEICVEYCLGLLFIFEFLGFQGEKKKMCIGWLFGKFDYFRCNCKFFVYELINLSI